MAIRKPKKSTAIKKEIKRLDTILANVDETKKSLVEGLIKRAAFMRATLEEMEIDLDENGFTEMFSQSEHQDPYERVRPVATQYQTMNKNYQAIMKQLTDLLPKGPPKEGDDGFEAFVMNRD
ncbi:hypothetical protein QUF56_09320 [Ureibacillus composti]|nr:hypothetical protein [Ureibacillus composti]